MGMFTSINIAATGMSAERLRTDVISNNIAYASSTRTPEGGVFKRSRVILAQRKSGIDWKTPFVPSSLHRGMGTGVKVVGIEKDTSDSKWVYDPNNADAIQTGPRKGFVEYPNVDVVTEMVDLISASRAYDANVAVVQGAKDMFHRALDIIK